MSRAEIGSHRKPYTGSTPFPPKWVEPRLVDFGHPDYVWPDEEPLDDDHQPPSRNGDSPAEEPTPTRLPDLDDVLNTDEPDHDWLVDGLLERGDRTIITGGEGQGKSTLFRQVGVQLASGIHPFTLEQTEPVTVMFVDCENSRRQTRRHLGPLRAAAGDNYRPGFLRFGFRPDGLDLTLTPDRDWLRERLDIEHPELLLLGPSYKLATGDPKDEPTARTVALYLDKLRAEYAITLVIEAHVPYGEGGKNSRPIRPYGASLWSRWPEFGIYLAEDGTLTHWRGAREERAWPTKLQRDGEPWPWMLDTLPEREEWDGPTRCIAAVVGVLEAVAPTELSLNALVTEMKVAGHPFRKQTVSEAAERAAARLLISVRSGPRNSRMYSTSAIACGFQEPLDEI